MRLENVVRDSRDPQRLGRFWAAALGAEQITDEPDLVEARLQLGGASFLDLCFPRVEAPSTSPARLHLDVAGGARPDEVVARLLALGARRADIGQGQVPWVVLEDPEGGAFCVVPGRGGRRGTGPVAALLLDSADPARDAAFWAALTGWVPTESSDAAVSLRHPSGEGPVLELWREPEPKRGKNRVHLDVRRESGDGDVGERLRRLGATALSAPGEHPWLVVADPSGNELCVLG
ncbi:VOC family protein [uncultured Pseudokineococcus sp.]|uniref:VOC family protein n=1 Tax=uncultured Pseudokineococcus sp. TaxID=1642928 RepID=UPI00260177B6|nr:VOC family protein [uncultured Pseudokineococcus sp.]